MSGTVLLRDGWLLWSCACLRAAGFPAELVLDLASSALAGSVDRLLDHEALVVERRQHVIAEYEAALGRLSPEQADERRALQRALKHVRQLRAPGSEVRVAAEATGRLADALARTDELMREVTADYGRARRTASVRLRELARDDRFRQAMLWQNRNAVRGSVDSLLRQPADATDSKTRKDELLVASYLQRYCVKNDTIGFFGPVGWARIEASPVALVQRPGPTLLGNRTVYYEYWAMDALATTLSRDPDIRPFVAPRRLPHCRLEGTTLHHPVERQTELPREFAAMLSLCDGARTAREIARELCGDTALDVRDEAEVFEMLDELAGKRVIEWSLEIPTADAHPDRQLAALLERIELDEVRSRALGLLAELDRRRAAVAAASDATELDKALEAFGTSFTRITTASSHRASGASYAGRTPLYEECRRDLELTLGQSVVDALGPPLALLLRSARWFTYELASRYRRDLAAIHRRLSTAGGSTAIDFIRFWEQVPPLFPGSAVPGSIGGNVRDELRRRWAMVLDIGPAERIVHRRSSGLVEPVERAFSAPGPGWPLARHHCPDVMIGAEGPDAVERGDYVLVIGELHVGFHTFVTPLFAKQHPSPADLVAARDSDIGHVGIAPVWTKAVTRADYYSLSPRDLDLENGEARSARPPSHVVAAADLVVVEQDNRLEVRTRDGTRRFDIIAFLEHHLVAECYAAWSLLAPAPRTPRITIDRVVIARETWQIEPAELAWPRLETPCERFVAARRWARSLQMPRWVFVKTPEEAKPMYVDYDSTVCVEILAKQLRVASAASLSEMLPAVDATWVIDAEGSRYTSELRVCAVDPQPWRAE